MIDVATLKSSLATASGDVQVRLGLAELTSTGREESGTLTYPEIRPTKFARWRSAEIVGLVDPNTDAIRVRFISDQGTFWFDRTDMTFKKVTAVDWASEFTFPWLLGNLDLWAHESLTLLVHLVSTDLFPAPRVTDVRVMLDFPTWPGAVAQAVKDITDFVSLVEFTLIHQETLAADRGSWKIGNPHSEHNYDVRSVDQVVVNGDHKSATLVNGEVVLEGPAAPTGSTVEIAVSVKPTTAVRRADESRTVHRTPEWWFANLVSEGGLVGSVPSMMIGGEEIQLREQELRITVNGIAHRQADALAMRLALEAAFAEGLVITFPSGRCVFAQLPGPVEVVEEGSLNLPMATGSVLVVLKEFVFTKTVRRQRDDAGDALLTQLTLLFPDDLEFEFTESGFTNVL
jgi:hypothetical protein